MYYQFYQSNFIYILTVVNRLTGAHLYRMRLVRPVLLFCLKWKMAALKENTNVSEESDHLEDVENGESNLNGNNSEVNAKKKKKKKNKKKTAAVSAEVNGQNGHQVVMAESGKGKEDPGDEEKDGEDVAGGNLFKSIILTIQKNVKVFLGDENAATKKKKKNRSKKKTAVSTDSKTVVIVKGQTEPPTIPIVALFPDGKQIILFNYAMSY